MKTYTRIISSLSRGLDIIAAASIVAMAVLVTVNILMRGIFKQPLLGTMDIVNILMVLAISLGLAHCALKNGHIAVEFIVIRFSDKCQGIIGIIISGAAILFWGAVVWFMGAYAHSMMLSNQLAGTVAIPLYPAVLAAALGILALQLVIVIKLVDAVRMAAE